MNFNIDSPLGKVSDPSSFEKAKKEFNIFGSHKYLSGTKEFLESNSIVAKFAFLLLVLIVFVIILRLATYIIGMLAAPSPDPYLIKGMVDAKKMRVIDQNPNHKHSIPILRSVNQRDGIEFTWAVWIFINDFQYKEGQYKHIFHKGNDEITQSGEKTGLNFPNNAPGLYLSPYTNELLVIMNTFDTINEEIIIPDIPTHKWVSVMIKCDGKNLDVYINGTLTRRHILKSVPKQNYDKVYVAMNGGFSGYISDLRYFNKAIGTNEIQSIVTKGPDMKMDNKDKKGSEPYYFSTRWFFSGLEDAYNP